jgi:predicted ArsR family transcriptional regulator
MTSSPNTKSKPANGNGITKKDQLIKLLGTKSGADIKSLSEKLGWQQHTTRAALSGLRKAGYQIAAVKAGNGKPSRYQIIGAPKVDAA